MNLPSELISDILSVALVLHPRPVSILLASSQFYHLSVRQLYDKLHFKSHRQIGRFLRTYGRQPSRIPFPPHEIELDVDNDATVNVFSYLRDLFFSCSLANDAEVDERGKLVVELLRLRLHSLSQGLNPGTIYDTLCAINPRRFIWTGRDPPHHFSTAIVPRVIPLLFRALKTYTYLSYVELTHLSFDTLEQDLALSFGPSVQEVCIGQATFLSPSMIATYILSPGAERLQRVRLVDTYIESIWGLRLRRSDVERAAVALFGSPTNTSSDEQAKNQATDLVRRLVLCEGRTERIVGGDRVTDNAVLI
ncbi:hypothetical protein AX15_000355 [Amanita polypyramis BW_CC]|nr:hypothetical protein AX15_000355 [Amanita polypyramis BW_CC]